MINHLSSSRVGGALPAVPLPIAKQEGKPDGPATPKDSFVPARYEFGGEFGWLFDFIGSGIKSAGIGLFCGVAVGAFAGSYIGALGASVGAVVGGGVGAVVGFVSGLTLYKVIH
mgnify:CR=1 FL=1